VGRAHARQRPDFVILTLAVSKVEGVVVPLDPTTGNRELEMILEAARCARW
jgi:acyl-CoA synthetase (AMP-forming)/AMP-acid ligase II